MCKQTRQKRRKKEKKRKMFLTRNGNLIPVCGTGKAKVDYSILIPVYGFGWSRSGLFRFYGERKWNSLKMGKVVSDAR